MADLPVRMLMVEDSADDAALILREFQRASLPAEVTRVQTRAEFVAALDSGEWDLVICDYMLPTFDALAALACLRDLPLDLPLIVVSGKIGEDMAVAAMRAGANDYVMKDNLARLPEAVRRELQEARSRAERRTAEEALRQQRALLEALVGSAMDAIITLDSDQRIVLFNPAAEAMFGWPAAEMLGQPLDRLLPLAFRDSHRQHIARFGESGATSRSMRVQTSFAGLRASGEEFPVEATISKSPVGGQKYYMVIVRDITERRRLEAELLQAQKMEAIGRLAGGVAHDFNNLLTAIMGYSELALMEADEPARAEASLMEIRAAADRAAGLTRQLLALSRRTMAAPAPIDLASVVSELQRMLQRVIGLNYELRTALTADAWPVRADRGQVEQVLLNLVVNAQDAMPFGGPITLAVENREVRNPHAPVPPGRYVVLSVADEGTGIDADTREQIFEPFFTTKEPGRGTGLGLAIVRSVLEQCGGAVTVESEPGHGSTFQVFFPRDDAASPEPEQPLLDVPGGHETLLLMEADPQVRQLEQQFLAQHGYRVLAATDPREAQDLLRQRNGEIALLVTNVVLIGMRGPELAAALREISPGLRVLFLAGYNDDALLREVQAIGAALLEKPFGSLELARAVRSALDE